MLFKLFICLLLIYCIWSCSAKQTSEDDDVETQIDKITVLGTLPEKVIFPPDNLYSEDKAKLGKILFYDPILSGNKDVACATCHHPDFGYADFLDLSIGVNAEGFGSSRSFTIPNDIPFVKRNSQSIVNTAFNGITIKKDEDYFDAPMFWDLRVSTLEKQSLEPIKAFEEMRGHGFEEKNILPQIIQRLKNNDEYKGLFIKAFDEKEPITEQNLAKAIATFERTLVSNNSRFDQYMRGDNTVLSVNELEGLQVFLKAGCAKCHNGSMFSDFKVHSLGVNDNEKLLIVDKGFKNKFQFRTPTLRNLRFTEPYMNNGKIKTLQNVLEFYEDLSGLKIQNPNLEMSQIDPLMKQSKVNFKDIPAIIEFLNTLNDDNYDKSMPKSVPSGLPVGGNIR